jgi:peptidyl-prolyl cis-trans isomerase A (cyclophilin A)
VLSPVRSLAITFALTAAPIYVACGPGPIPYTPPPLPGANVPIASVDPVTGRSLGPPATSATVGSTPPPPAEAVHHDPATLDPALATAKAPEVFRARFTTTKGTFVVEVHRAWAPNGADRFYNLVKMGFYDDTRIFRVISGFMAQFGIPGDPKVATKWRAANIQDDPVAQSNKRGFVTFAQTSQANSRSTQIFINFADNTSLDGQRFAPFGQVVQGMNVVDALYPGYGEGRPGGQGPDQSRIQESGNRYLDEDFPQLDRILSTAVM